MFIGILLLILGVLMFLERTGVISGSFGDYIIPAALVALGLSMVLDHKKKTTSC